MKSFSIFTLGVLSIAMLAAVPAAEAKGPPKGKGQVSELKMNSDAKEMTEEKAQNAKKLRERKMEQKKEKLKGLEKQQMKKADRVQKKTGKGSGKGQALRKEHSKKWWKFGFGKEEVPLIPVEE